MNSGEMIKAGKVILSLVVPGTLAVLYWLDRYPFIRRELSRGGLLPVWFIAAVIFLTPFVVILGVAAIDKYFHAKEGYKLGMSEAFYKVVLASTPLAINAVVLAILDAYSIGAGDPWQEPFTFFMFMWMPFGELILGDILSGSVLVYLGWLILHYGAGWVGFFLIYVKLAKIRKQRLYLALAVIPVFVTIVEVVRIGLVGIWID